ncbi:hypothetical protein ACTS9E_15080 [Empedobacter brevis]
MEETRTYKEAVDIMIDWWVEKIQQPFNQNNGDTTSDFGFFLLNKASMDAQFLLNDSKIEKFKNSLKEQLYPNEGKHRMYKELDVDYSPNEILNKACEFSGINTSCLPVKTFTYIENNNKINGRFQYGGEWFEI